MGREAGYISPAPPRQRHGFIKKRFGPCYHAISARGVKRAAHRRLTQRIGAIKRIIKAAPAGIGGVQGKAGIGDRHHQLRPGDTGNFRVHIFGFNAERRGGGQQVANVLQKLCIIALWLKMPRIYLRLQLGPPRQKGTVFLGEITEHHGEPGPKVRHIQPFQGLAFYKIIQCCGHFQASDFNKLGHVRSLVYLCRPV